MHSSLNGYFSKWEAWRSLLRSSSCCSSNSGTAAVATRALSEALWLCEERSWGRRRGASQAWLRRRLHQPPCPKAAGGLRTLPPSQLPRESCIYLFLCLHLYGITAILFKSLWAFITIIYFDIQITPDLASRSPFSLLLCPLLHPQFSLSIFLHSAREHSWLTLYLSCLSSRINSFSQKPRFFLVENGILTLSIFSDSVRSCCWLVSLGVDASSYLIELTLNPKILRVKWVTLQHRGLLFASAGELWSWIRVAPPELQFRSLARSVALLCSTHLRISPNLHLLSRSAQVSAHSPPCLSLSSFLCWQPPLLSWPRTCSPARESFGDLEPWGVRSSWCPSRASTGDGHTTWSHSVFAGMLPGWNSHCSSQVPTLPLACPVWLKPLAFRTQQ